MRLTTIVGARPQFIKAVTVSRVLSTRPHITELMIHTGQHYDKEMSDIFFTDLEIPNPNYTLGIGSGSHAAQTGKMMIAVERALLQARPDLVLVYGDTNSTLAGALAAVKLHIPVAHVEAGLRSFNRAMPEEINRVLTDHAADILFAPTIGAAAQLGREGLPEERIHVVGDVMYDAVLIYGDKAESESRILGKNNLDAKTYILATVHRAENTDDPSRLEAILNGLALVSDEVSLPVVMPIHPRTKAAIENSPAQRRKIALTGISFIDPVGYLDMIMLEKNARLITTDSGGVQKEAFFFQVPCVTLREETEWVELVDLGWNRLAPPKSASSVAAQVRAGLNAPVGLPGKPYGDGQTAQRIVDIILAQ